jgi:hypothetical protein
MVVQAGIGVVMSGLGENALGTGDYASRQMTIND